MAKTGRSFQYKNTISLNREGFTNMIVKNDLLGKSELRVLLCLLTHIDSKIAKSIDIGAMSDTLNMKKKKISESLEILVEEGIIEMYDDNVAGKAYKLSF